MYNGIGLPTARGSGTNGYVQRNWAFVRKTKDKIHYKTEEDLEKLEASSNRQPNRDILDHERKRKLEVKCIELEEILEDQGYSKGEIDTRVAAYRVMLVDNEGCKLQGALPRDEFGRINVRETHQIAEAQQEKNAKLREAFGISEYFVEGSSLDPQRHAKEAQAKAAAEQTRKYPLVRTPTPERAEPDTTKSAGDKTKSRKRKARESSSSPETKRDKKKKKSKKHKKDRSESPKPSKKKSAPKEKKKDKERGKRHRSSSTDSSSTSSAGSISSSATNSPKGRSRKKRDKNKHRRKTSEKPDSQSKEKRSRSERKQAGSGSKKRYGSSSDAASDSSPERKRMKISSSDTVVQSKTGSKHSLSSPSYGKLQTAHRSSVEKASKKSSDVYSSKLNGKGERTDVKISDEKKNRKGKEKEKEKESSRKREHRNRSSSFESVRKSRSPAGRKADLSHGKDGKHYSPPSRTKRSDSPSFHRRERKSHSQSPSRQHRGKTSKKLQSSDSCNRSRSPFASHVQSSDWKSKKPASPKRKTGSRRKSLGNSRSPSANGQVREKEKRSESHSPVHKRSHHSRSRSHSPHQKSYKSRVASDAVTTSPKRNHARQSESPASRRRMSRTHSRSPRHKSSYKNSRPSVSPKRNTSKNEKSSRDERRVSKSPDDRRESVRARPVKSPARKERERTRDSFTPKHEKLGPPPKKVPFYESKNKNKSGSSRASSTRTSTSHSPTGRISESYRNKSSSKKSQSFARSTEKSSKKNTKSRSRSRSHPKNARPNLVMPRVRLRSSSREEEDEIDDKINREKENEDEAELQTLKMLQTGLAEKAKESLGKKLLKLSPELKPTKKDEKILIREREEKVTTTTTMFCSTGMYFDINLPDREESKDIQKSLEEQPSSPVSSSSAVPKSPDYPLPLQPALIPKPPGSPPTTTDMKTTESGEEDQGVNLEKTKKKIKNLEAVRRRRRSESSSQSRSRSPDRSSHGSHKSHKSRSSSRSSYSKSSSRRSVKSYSSGSSSRSRSRSLSGSRSRSRSHTRSRSRSQSRSVSRSASSGSSSSGSRSSTSRKSASPGSSQSSRSRSPSIPRRRGSPSFLDRRRITSSKSDGRSRSGSLSSPLDGSRSSSRHSRHQ